MATQELHCSICSKLILPDEHGWKHGHNAEPINDGRCCTDCNNRYVLPARIIAIYRAEQNQ